MQPGASFVASAPRMLFEGRFYTSINWRNYDVSPDGRRFLMIKEQAENSDASGPSQFTVVLNWFDELKRLAPQK